MELENKLHKLMANYYDHFMDQLVIGSPSGGVSFDVFVKPVSLQQLLTAPDSVIEFSARYKYQDEVRFTIRKIPFTFESSRGINRGGKSVNRFFILGDADVDIWIFKDYITACAEQFPVTSIETIILLDKSVIEILHEIDYWKKFKEEQAIELFKAFGDSRMLPEKIRDLFVF